jgi:hypothetical protein
VRHAEPLRPRRAATLVAVEQLQHTCRLAQRAHALVELGRVDRIDQPDAALDKQRVRAATHELVQGPAEAALPLVNQRPLTPHAGP